MVMAVALLSACGPAATPVPPLVTHNDPPAVKPAPDSHVENPYAPQPGDVVMMRGELTIDSASLILTMSMPPQVTLKFAYLEPTPCYKLRVAVSQPDAQNRINISAYAVAEKDKPCALMALATDLQASLSLGSFPKGHYSVWLNGVKVDEFDS